MRISELPEIGTKYEIESPKGDKVAVIFLTTGDKHSYLLSSGGHDRKEYQGFGDQERNGCHDNSDIKGGRSIINPPPETLLEGGDLLVLICWGSSSA